MTEPIVIRFIPTPQDYVRITRTLYVRQPVIWVFFVLMTLLSIMPFCLLVTGSRLHLFTILLAPLALIFFAILVFLVNPWRAGYRAKKNERMTAEVTWEASEELILLKSIHTDAKTDWGNFKKAFESDEFFFFKSSMANLYQFIPKRAFETPAQLEAFRALVKTKLPGLK